MSLFTNKDDPEKEFQKAEDEAIASIIDQSASINGDLTFQGKTRIDGQMEGNIKGKHLILTKSGTIKGDIELTSFVCHGSMTGNIKSKIVTAKKGCSINGKLEAESLTVEPGASIDGEIKAATQGLQLADGAQETPLRIKPPKVSETP
jgi:cytoskeletal protein CcmA (bactofilin family)